MNKIRIISDVHCEFGPIDLPVMENEDQQILVVAGDLGLAAKPWTHMPFLEEWSERFQDVIYILGNHEYYGTSIVRGLDKIKANVDWEILPNVHVANNDVIRIGTVSFVCSTMWASYNKQDPVCLYDAGLWMNDHKKIRNGPKNEPYKRKFSSNDAYREFLISINFIFPAIEKEKNDGQQVVVVTHHAPSWQSIAEQYKTGPHAMLNGAYASDLDSDILEIQPDMWIHGHTHISFDYNIGDTQVICNPFGYKDHEENPDFNPELVIAL